SRSGRERLLVRAPGLLELDDVSADGRALVGHHTRVVSMWGQAPGETAERDLSWLDASVPGDLSPDGKTLTLSETGEGGAGFGSIYARGTDGSPAVRLGEGRGGALSPDGRRVVAVLDAGAGPAPRPPLPPAGAGRAG